MDILRTINIKEVVEILTGQEEQGEAWGLNPPFRIGQRETLPAGNELKGSTHSVQVHIFKYIQFSLLTKVFY